MSTKAFGKKRRSVVRFLASCIPSFLWEYFIPVPPRMYINSTLIHKLSALKQNNFSSDDSNTSFCSFKQNFHNGNQQLILNSTPKRIDVEDNKLKALQEDLDEVKKIVAKLMEKQCDQCSDYGTLSNPSDQLQKSFTPVLPPPPPPPLPPPMPPNFSLKPVNSPLKIEKKNNVAPQFGFPCGKELLKDLKKVKLKKVEKSPGGGPLKKSKTPLNDPGDILAAVLRKRYDLVQNSPDSSLESLNKENSFGSETINNSYEVSRNKKITVL